MPYVFMDELEEGMTAADVRSVDDYDALQVQYDTMVGERDELQRQYDELHGINGTLMAELDDAKTKFANAFLSSPQAAKRSQDEEIKSEDKPMNFNSLFTGRNSDNAN